jgi:hypothetical protein
MKTIPERERAGASGKSVDYLAAAHFSFMKRSPWT